MTLDIAPLYGPTPSSFSRDNTVLPATHAFIHEWNEPYIPLPSQSKLVLIYRSRRDGRLSWHRHTMVSKQSARDRYITEISYQLLRLSRLTGQLETQQAMSFELTTSRAESRDANHYATEVSVRVRAGLG